MADCIALLILIVSIIAYEEHLYRVKFEKAKKQHEDNIRGE